MSPIVLAPLAGVTSLPFRILCRETGANKVFTEMVSATSIVNSNKVVQDRLLASDETERPVAAQIFGNSPEIIKEAARIICSTHNFDEINLNLGCPAQKIIKSGARGALMKRDEETRLKLLLEALVHGAEEIPVSVKMRLGWKKEANYLEIAEFCEEIGYREIILHARYVDETYKHPARWESITRLVDNTSLLVTGNGDLFSIDDANRLMDETGCDSAMIGRAARVDPLLFNGNDDPTEDERKSVYMRLIDIASEFEMLSVSFAKNHALSFARGFPGVKILRNSITKSRNIDEIISLFSS